MAEQKETTVEKKETVKKTEAIVRGESIRLSMKVASYINSFIKNKKIDDALNQLEEVLKMKRAIPYKGEIPHRKGDMMSGRYPQSGSKIYVTLLKTLRGNAVVNGLNLDKTTIYYASSGWAQRPPKAGRAKGKRANVIIKCRENTK